MAGDPSARRRRVPTAVLLVALIVALAGCDFSSAVATPSTAVPIRILLFDGGFCPTAGFPARLTFRIDPAAAEQVTAIDETATTHRVWWPEGFRGGTAVDPVVRAASSSRETARSWRSRYAVFRTCTATASATVATRSALRSGSRIERSR